MMHNPLLDSDFLKDLAEQRERTVYARIEMLNMQEEPEEEVFGRVTQGTITIDGNSSVRRSLSGLVSGIICLFDILTQSSVNEGAIQDTEGLSFELNLSRIEFKSTWG